jgi:hypothetical protein
MKTNKNFCLICNKLFFVYPSQNTAKFCSRKCYHESKKTWKKKDIQILKKVYSIKSRNEILKNLPGKSWEAIRSKAKKIEGLTRIRNSKQLIFDNLPDIKLKKWEKAWLASAIDCDGSISIRHCSKVYSPVISFSNTNKKIIEFFRDLLKYKPQIYICKENRTYNSKKSYSLAICSMPHVYIILKQILPFLIGKKEQGKLILGWIKIQDKKIRKGNNKGWAYTKRQNEIHNKMKNLNKKGYNEQKQVIS